MGKKDKYDDMLSVDYTKEPLPAPGYGYAYPPKRRRHRLMPESNTGRVLVVGGVVGALLLVNAEKDNIRELLGKTGEGVPQQLCNAVSDAAKDGAGVDIPKVGNICTPPPCLQLGTTVPMSLCASREEKDLYLDKTADTTPNQTNPASWRVAAFVHLDVPAENKADPAAASTTTVATAPGTPTTSVVPKTSLTTAGQLFQAYIDQGPAYKAACDKTYADMAALYRANAAVLANREVESKQIETLPVVLLSHEIIEGKPTDVALSCTAPGQ